MIMQEQSRHVSEPLRWGQREKTAVAVVLSCAALALIGLGVYALTSGAPARAGCISLTFASTLGGAQVHECGAKARGLCASPSSFRTIAQEVRATCKRAGYPVGAF
jgi:hypothetical protein